MTTRYRSVLLLVAGLAVGLMVGHRWQPQTIFGTPLRANSSEYKFINPLLACEIAPEGEFSELAPLKNKLETIYKDALAKPEITNLSIYFRGLNRGRWIELNGAHQYRPASLLKVLVAIANYHYDEEHPGHLNTYVQYRGPQIIFKNSKANDETTLKTGQTYRRSELVERLLIYSDNQANNLLVDSIPEEYLTQVARDLNIQPPANPADPFISPESYSVLFRLLYNATYLSRADSDKLLNILARSEYRDGLVSGVPTKTTVSHKFGIRDLGDAGIPLDQAATTEELHDCGIIYYPDHPYFLCVMTSGKDYHALAKVIQQISHTTYQWIDDFWQQQPATPPTKPQ